MLADLNRHADDEVDFRDRLPYVLDLLAGVTRCIDSESKGHRTTRFATWWSTTDRTTRNVIQELRNAELKRAESRAKQEMRVEMQRYGEPLAADTAVNGLALRTDGLTESQFTIVVTTEWQFIGGDFDGRPVLLALTQYWNDINGVLKQAESLLGE